MTLRGLLPFLTLLHWLVGCSYVTEQDLADRMDLDGDGVPRPVDCDDQDTGVRGARYFVDADGDGFGGPNASGSCEWEPGVADNADDCDDTDELVHPGADERCNEQDDDCDLDVDEGLELPTWYLDFDGDGYGGSDLTTQACSAPSGYVASSNDCDDADLAVNPAGQEVCDPDDADEDCDGLADDVDPDVQDLATVYQDQDGDGFGVEEVTTQACDDGDGWAFEAGDCDDQDAERHPDTWWYRDADEDGYGDAAYGVRACADVVGYVRDDQDCDDAEPSYSPAGQEVCDLYDVDEDCDGLVDDADPTVAGQLTIYEDVDGDGYGDDATETLACDLWSGWVVLHGDCEPDDASLGPGTVEDCTDGADQDCDGFVDCDDVNCSSTELCGYFDLGAADAKGLGYQYYEDAGAAVAWVGDMSGDAVPDYLVSSTQWGSGSGVIYTVDGAASGAIDLFADSVASIWGETYNDRLGSSLAAIGDIDGDGQGDFVAGAYQNCSLESYAGAIYVFLGPVSGSAAVSAAADGVIYGDTAGAYIGTHLAGSADVTGDGVPDIVSYTADGPGAPVISGADALGTSAVSDVAVTFLGHINLAGVDAGDLDGDGLGDVVTSGYTVEVYSGPITGSSAASASFTGLPSMAWVSEASCGGDIDGDGVLDLVLAVPQDDTAGADAGISMVYASPIGSSVDFYGSAVAQITGSAAGDWAGYDMEVSEDIDGDGFGDLVIAAPYADEGGYDSGAVYVLFGPVSGSLSVDDADVIFAGEATEDNAGWAISASADADGDGRNDLLITAPEQDGTGPGRDYGASYLFLGARF